MSPEDDKLVALLQYIACGFDDGREPRLTAEWRAADRITALNAERESLLIRVERAEAEKERIERGWSIYRGDLMTASNELDREHAQRVEAEARVEGAEAALRRLLALCEAGGDPFAEPGLPTVNAARAALPATEATK